MLLPILSFGPMAMALVSWLAGRRSKKLRDITVAATGIAAFLLTLPLWFGESTFDLPGFCGFGLHLRADGFRNLYASIAAFMWAVSGLFSPEYFAHHHQRNRYYFFNLLTLGATLGVFLSDDLYTTLIFFEVMSLASFPWVAQEETRDALKAAGTYLAIAVIGGLVTLMGLFLLWHELGTLSFDGMKAALSQRPAGQDGLVTAASWLTLFGFAAKAGMFPLHIWLPKAHPVAPAPASSLLSGILTKSGIFGVLVIASRLMEGNRGFANALLVFACVTMFLGALLALFSVNLKRTLACSSMSQIGFITVGISMLLLLGEEGTLAAYGTIQHMVNHSLIKLCLFLCAGVVYMNLHQLELSDIAGFGRKKPLLHFCFLSGALSIACIPPFGSGFNSKSLLHEGILEYIAVLKETGASWGIYKFVEILFLISGGLTVAYMTKLYICLFWDRNTKKRQAEFDAMTHYIKPVSAIGLVLVSAVLPFLGMFGGALMTPLAERSMSFLKLEGLHHSISYFSGENLLGALESIAIGAVVYLAIVKPWMIRQEHHTIQYINRWPKRLDLEELIYRPLLLKVLPGILTFVIRPISILPEILLLKTLPRTLTLITRPISVLPEMTVYLARISLFRPRQEKQPVSFATRITIDLGLALNRIAIFLNREVFKRHPIRTDFEFVLERARLRSKRNFLMITASVSFGLLLLIIGLYATVLYLILQ